jgi:hypothetical protein
MSEKVPCMASMTVLLGGLTTLNGLFSSRDDFRKPAPTARVVTGDAVMITVSTV